MSTVISVENLSKSYRLGQINTGTFTYDLQLWWARLRGKPNPFLTIGETDHGNRDGEILWALKDVSFKVEQGEVLGIIGRNGAGKSTLLKVLSRVTAPTSGKVKIKGRIASLLEVGTGFHPDLTGRENVYLNGAIMGMDKQEVARKFDEIVDFSGVEKFIDTPVKRYSSGMYVRLAFAVAAHLEPEILIVDEVLAVGDAEFQKKCLGKMGEVAHDGRTVLFVSHNMGAIRSICPQLLLLQNGRLLQNGESDAVVRYYLSSSLPSVKDNCEVIWSLDENAPGNDEMRLKQARLLNSSGNVQFMFDYLDQICIEVIYEVYKPIRGGQMGLILNTEEGEVAFASIEVDSNIKEMLPGAYRMKIILPGGLLNQRHYIVNIQSAVPNIRYIIPATRILSFVISGGGQPGSKNPEKWPGVVAPKLNWKTEKIEDAIEMEK